MAQRRPMQNAIKYFTKLPTLLNISSFIYDSMLNLQVAIFGVTNAADSANADKESNKSPNCQPK